MEKVNTSAAWDDMHLFTPFENITTELLKLFKQPWKVWSLLLVIWPHDIILLTQSVSLELTRNFNGSLAVVQL